jgi:putative oxidoreductase
MFILFFIGRIIFGGYFIYNGTRHFRNVKTMAGYASTKSVPFPAMAVILTGTLLFLGGISIVLGILPFIGLICLAVFLIPVTFIMHSFWADTEPQAKMANRIHFGKNMALLGAVTMLFIIPRPWPWSSVHWSVLPWSLCKVSLSQQLL